MSVTKQDPAQRGKGAGHTVPFEAFLMWLHIDARARNDTEWVEWYKGWLKDLPEGDGREDYIEKSRADYEKRMGETVDEYLDRTHDERLAQLHKESRAEYLAESSKKRRAEYLAESSKRHRAEYLAESSKKRRAEALVERTKKYVEDATNHQIMVENFKMFQREYVDMMIRRCG